MHEDGHTLHTLNTVTPCAAAAPLPALFKGKRMDGPRVSYLMSTGNGGDAPTRCTYQGE
jgi:hypothetical protein